MFDGRFWLITGLGFFYIGITTFFLYKLYRLNDILLSGKYDDNPVKLLMYNEYQPLKYFGMTILLGVCGVGSIFFYIHCVKEYDLTLAGMIAAGVFVIVAIILIICLLLFINNPILRAVFLVTLLVIGGGYVMTGN